MEGLEQKAVELLDKLESVVVNYAPQVVDLGLNVIRIEALGNVALIIILGMLAGLVPFMFYKLYKILSKKFEETKNDDYELGRFFTVLVGITSFIILVWAMLWHIVNIWLWIGLFYPELALAHKLIS